MLGPSYAVIGSAVGASNADGLEVAALPTRSGSAKSSTYFPLTPQSLANFDWLAVLNSTGYSRGGPPVIAS